LPSFLDFPLLQEAEIVILSAFQLFRRMMFPLNMVNPNRLERLDRFVHDSAVENSGQIVSDVERTLGFIVPGAIRVDFPGKGHADCDTQSLNIFKYE
jgi:hypothetical protein